MPLDRKMDIPSALSRAEMRGALLSGLYATCSMATPRKATYAIARRKIRTRERTK
jgi:hypothetical protein